MMDITNLIKSEGYKDARKKITNWTEQLKTSDSKTTMQIRDELKDFFSQLKKAKPQLYAVFQGQHKQLSETVYEKLSGKQIIID